MLRSRSLRVFESPSTDTCRYRKQFVVDSEAVTLEILDTAGQGPFYDIPLLFWSFILSPSTAPCLSPHLATSRRRDSSQVSGLGIHLSWVSVPVYRSFWCFSRAEEITRSARLETAVRSIVLCSCRGTGASLSPIPSHPLSPY